MQKSLSRTALGKHFRGRGLASVSEKPWYDKERLDGHRDWLLRGVEHDRVPKPLTALDDYEFELKLSVKNKCVHSQMLLPELKTHTQQWNNCRWKCVTFTTKLPPEYGDDICFTGTEELALEVKKKKTGETSVLFRQDYGLMTGESTSFDPIPTSRPNFMATLGDEASDILDLEPENMTPVLDVHNFFNGDWPRVLAQSDILEANTFELCFMLEDHTDWYEAEKKLASAPGQLPVRQVLLMLEYFIDWAGVGPTATQGCSAANGKE